MDDKWIYGYEPEQIFATISQGRPNGMPAFGGSPRSAINYAGPVQRSSSPTSGA